MPLDIKSYLLALAEGADRSEAESFDFFQLLTDETSELEDAHIAAYLMATSCRGFSCEDFVGAVRALRARMLEVHLSGVDPSKVVMDTCGTGGSGLGVFNISTAVAFVVAASGHCVAKHGNRAMSGNCCSADLLEEIGLRIDMGPAEVEASLASEGFAFMFAPSYHPATKRVQLLRRKLGVRSIFNFLGPMVNPASVSVQLIGISDRRVAEVIARALPRLGFERAMLLSGDEGLDEASIASRTWVAELRAGVVETYEIKPEDFALERAPLSAIKGGNTSFAAAKFMEVLRAKDGPYLDAVLLNAGLALYLCDVAESIEEGVLRASSILKSGAAYELYERLRSSKWAS